MCPHTLSLPQVYVSLIDSSGSTPVVLSPILVTSGATTGLMVSSAVVAPDRFTIVYGDGFSQPWTVDMGVSSGSFVSGRCVAS